MIPLSNAVYHILYCAAQFLYCSIYTALYCIVLLYAVCIVVPEISSTASSLLLGCSAQSQSVTGGLLRFTIPRPRRLFSGHCSLLGILSPSQSLRMPLTIMICLKLMLETKILLTSVAFDRNKLCQNRVRI